MTPDGNEPVNVARRKADGHFSTIANEALRDDRLSYRARGVLAAALTHSKAFRCGRRWLIKDADHRKAHPALEGKYAIGQAIAELRAYGYVFDEWVLVNGVPVRHLAWTDHPTAVPTGADPSEDAGSPKNRVDREIGKTEKPVDRPTGRPENRAHIEKINSEEDQRREEDQVGRAADAAPTDRGRGGRSFRPKPEDVPAELAAVTEELLGFWAEKAGSRSQRAWLVLLTELGKIQSHMDGGTQVVREQLQAGTQAGWTSCTFTNWLAYGQKRGRASPANSRVQRQEEARRRVVAFLEANDPLALGDQPTWQSPATSSPESLWECSSSASSGGSLTRQP